MSLEERIVRLERQNRWMKCAAVVLLGLFFTLGQSKPPLEVRARKFVLVDENGEVKGQFGYKADGTALIIRDKSNGQMILEVSSMGPGITMRGKHGMAGMTVYPDKPGGHTGSGSVSVSNLDGTAGVMLLVNEDQSTLALYSKGGKIAMSGSRTVDPFLAIQDPDEKILFKAP